VKSAARRSIACGAKERWRATPARLHGVIPRGLVAIANGRNDGDPAPALPGFRDPSWNSLAMLAELGKLSASRPVSIGRSAHATEVAAAVAFFGAPEASFVTGRHPSVSGGMAMI